MQGTGGSISIEADVKEGESKNYEKDDSNIYLLNRNPIPGQLLLTSVLYVLINLPIGEIMKRSGSY